MEKEFDSIKDAFIYLVKKYEDKNSDEYKALSAKQRGRISDASHNLKKGKITRDHMINLLNEIFKVDVKVFLSLKEEENEKKITELLRLEAS